MTIKSKKGKLQFKTDVGGISRVIAGDVLLVCPDITGGTASVVQGAFRVSLRSTCFESSVLGLGVFKGNAGEIFKLRDGSLWEVKSENAYLMAVPPFDVLACPDDGKVTVKGADKTLDVEQLVGCRELYIASSDPFRGKRGETFTLTDGTIWEVVSGGLYLSEFNPKAFVCLDETGAKLKVRGETFNVQQMSGCYETRISSSTRFEGQRGEIFKTDDGSLWEVTLGTAYLPSLSLRGIMCPKNGEIKVGGETLNVRKLDGCYQSRISSPTWFRGNTGDFFKLDNGSLWEVTHGDWSLGSNRDVVICPNDHSLKISGKTLDIRKLEGCSETAISSPSRFDGEAGEIFKLADGSLWEVIENHYLAGLTGGSRLQGIALLSKLDSSLICPKDSSLKLNGKTVIVQQLSGATLLSPATERTFPKRIESRIESKVSFWSGDTIFKLANGQVWQQSSGGGWMPNYTDRPDRPKVVIYSVKSIHRMKVEGMDEEIIVQPLK